ncbi:hypothetical protein EVAR_99651_1 [Eumeta japonica]|uniref:Peptidase C45 hydrolase domain-containing protein n=1 Tax=Eumeta variegata TaxID=151549 RepID=A0A4C1ZGF9_EUMVA|nr:hypothetical protein EVAR_99651_1 [Eumeta japonica]
MAQSPALCCAYLEYFDAPELAGRRRAVPVLYSRGSHYQVGYDVGRTFGSLISGFIAGSERLREFERRADSAAVRAWRTPRCQRAARRRRRRRRAVQEANAERIPSQLFLLHMDDIIETIEEGRSSAPPAAVGCSSIAVLRPGVAVLGHTEDSFEDALNHWYVLSAHILPSDEEREQGAGEERFASLCYAGHLPGYTMGYSAAGMVFSVNTLSPRMLRPGRTPRVFLTRAMLAAKSFEDAQRILLDEGLGAANGCSVNMLWTGGQGTKAFSLHNIEVAPSRTEEARSQLDIRCYSRVPDAAAAEPLIHCNRYERLKVEEVRGPIILSSLARLKTIHSYATPTARAQIAKILSDTSGPDYRVFESRKNRRVLTIAAGIFDLESRTWSVYMDEPATSEPVAVLPLLFGPPSTDPPAAKQVAK